MNTLQVLQGMVRSGDDYVLTDSRGDLILTDMLEV